MQEEILKVAAEAAIQRREAAEASATPDERIAIQHAKAARAKELRKKEVSQLAPYSYCHQSAMCRRSLSCVSIRSLSMKCLPMHGSHCYHSIMHYALPGLQTANFQAEIMRQQQQKKEATKRKRMLASRSRYTTTHALS